MTYARGLLKLQEVQTKKIFPYELEGKSISLAERVGFEPTVREVPTTVFETVPFNHSGTSPNGGEGEYTSLFGLCHVISRGLDSSPRSEKVFQEPLGVAGQDAPPNLQSTFPGLPPQVGNAA